VQDIDPEGEDIIFYPSTYTWTKDEQRSATAHAIGAQLQHRFVLRIDEKLTFQRNVINLIVGPTASGKTSVLMALLGEYLVAHVT
jgi:predicted GTPase